MEVIFLGTSCMVPTKDRNHQGIFITYRSQGLLFDCGEGIQRQIKIAGIRPSKITKIFISHWHGDHVLGLPGLLQTLSASEYEGTLEIYGPKGTKKRFEHMFKAFEFDCTLNINILEIKDKTIFENKEFQIDALELEHRLPCFGFSFIEKDKRRIKLSYIKEKKIPQGPLLGHLQEGKTIEIKGKKISPKDATYIVQGKKISIINDTLLCNNCYNLAQDSDLLICEAVYHSDQKDRADEYMHLTAKQAALIASKSNVNKLILTHFSQRYKTIDPLLQEAKDIFPNTTAAHDFLKARV